MQFLKILFAFTPLGFFLVSHPLIAQSQIHGKADIEWVGGGEAEVLADVLNTFNLSNRELTSVIDLGAFLKNRDLKDSLEQADGPFVLTVRWTMLQDQIEFFSNKDDGKVVNAEAKITIGDSTRIMAIPLVFKILRDKNTQNYSGYGTNTLAARLNFLLKINPILYGLNRKPINWKRQFIVEVENGVINKK